MILNSLTKQKIYIYITLMLFAINMEISNQYVVKEFLDSIVRIVSEGSSGKYVLMVLKKIADSQKRDFPFVSCIKISLRGITIDKKINSINPKTVGRFLNVLVNVHFSRLFVLLLKKKMPPDMVKDLSYFGIEI